MRWRRTKAAALAQAINTGEQSQGATTELTGREHFRTCGDKAISTVTAEVPLVSMITKS
jgi:hypothetical protein